MLLLRCLLQIIDLHRETVPSWLLSQVNNSINVTQFINQCNEEAQFQCDEEAWREESWRILLSDGAHSFEAWSLDFQFNKMIEDIKVLTFDSVYSTLSLSVDPGACCVSMQALVCMALQTIFFTHQRVLAGGKV
jgi:hypothetical protein